MILRLHCLVCSCRHSLSRLGTAGVLCVAAVSHGEIEDWCSSRAFNPTTVPQGAEQINLSDNTRLAALCRVWGFLKYHHPDAATDAAHWDRVLLRSIDRVRNADDPAEFHQVLLNLIPQRTPMIEVGDARVDGGDGSGDASHDWMSDHALLSEPVAKRLHDIAARRPPGPVGPVSFAEGVGYAMFDAEQAYEDLTSLDEAHRLLALFRAWNAVEYYYPYKTGLDVDWTLVLYEMIPVFRDASDEESYVSAVKQLGCRIGDGHARVETPQTATRYFPADVRWVEGKVVVVGFPNTECAPETGLQRGDIIEWAWCEPIEARIAKLLLTENASNAEATMHRLAVASLSDEADQVPVRIRRAGSTRSMPVPLYTWEELNLESPRWKGRTPENEQVRMVRPRIGYIDMAVFKPVDDQAFQSLMSKIVQGDGLIIDLRCYPFWQHERLVGALTNESCPFVRAFAPVVDRPGRFAHLEPLSIGIDNGRQYTQPVVVLVDERSMSYSEFFAMALQTLPNVTVMGSQTAGADGNVTSIPLPGGLRLSMTGLGVEYPDGTPTQRVGVRIDIESRPTLNGLIAGRDEVLERAIEYLSSSD